MSTATKTATFSMTMLVCADVARSRDFYRDTFGLSVTQDGGPHWAALDLGNGVHLGLHPADGAGLTVKPGSTYIGFAVADVDAFVAGTRAPVLQQPADENFGRLAVIADPDGYAIQVFTLKP